MSSITRREDLPDFPFRRYHPIAKVITAIQLSEAEDIPSSDVEGRMFHGKAGDWKIIYGANSDGHLAMAICDGDIFRKIYEHVADHLYRKKTSFFIEAVQLEGPLDIMTLEGPSHGEPGNWLLLGIEGEPYFNDNDYFKNNYVLIDEEIP